jgi:hypothetical protein
MYLAFAVPEMTHEAASPAIRIQALFMVAPSLAARLALAAAVGELSPIMDLG